MTIRRTKLIYLLAWLIGGSQLLHAYEIGTHREIARRAVAPEVSSIDRILKETLNFNAGIRERFNGREVIELIGEGAVAEDDPVWRTINHFHNPLQPWDQAGLSVLAFGGQSSVLWQQNASQDTTTVRVGLLPIRAGGGNRSWQDARRHYLNALTRATKDDRDNAPGRDRAFAEMFETLGYLTHLIQDASVPAHTRNDSHLPILDAEGYEKHVEELRAAPANSRDRTLFESALNRDPVRPLESIFTPTGDLRAPVPIARLIDTDTFGGQNFEVLTLTNIGIAEYTNGNFLSDDTIFSDFGLPRRSSLKPDGFFEQEGDKRRRYFEKEGEGQRIQHFVAESALYEPANAELGRPMDEALVLTRRVYEDYAAELIPWAVGYSAALLDYFFRGTLDFTIGGSSPNQTLTITNKSDEAMEGTFTLYADDLSQVRAAVKSFPDLTLGPQAMTTSLTFIPPAEVQAYTLVFQGRLGNEEGAVAGKVKQIPLNAFFVWQVRLYNDQFDLVHRGSGFTGACFFSFVRSITSSGSHSGQRKDYLFFAFVNDANLPVSPLDPANLQLTTRASPSESIIPHFGIRYLPFSGSALGIIQPAGEFGCGPTVAWSFAPAVLGLYTAAQVDPNFLAKPTPPPNHYVYLADNDSLLHDTGVAASEDILVTKTLTKVTLEQIQQTASGLHPFLVPPASFPRSAALYAFAEFDIPNIDSWNLGFSIDPDELANQKLQWGGTTPIASISVAESWDLQSLTLLVSGEAEINISAPHQRIRRLDFQAVYGTQYQITLQRGLESLTLRHNPNDPFTPITESLP